MIVILMGVSGCGKSTIGRLLAERHGWIYLEGDDFHPPGNIAKLSAGIPLTDEERADWIAALRDALAGHLVAGRPAVLACSALREAHRRTLCRPGEPIRLVHLCGDISLIRDRLVARRGHFMPASLLASQFAALDAPADAIVVSVELPPAAIVRAVEKELGLVS